MGGEITKDVSACLTVKTKTVDEVFDVIFVKTSLTL